MVGNSVLPKGSCLVSLLLSLFLLSGSGSITRMLDGLFRRKSKGPEGPEALLFLEFDPPGAAGEPPDPPAGVTFEGAWVFSSLAEVKSKLSSASSNSFRKYLTKFYFTD